MRLYIAGPMTGLPGKNLRTFMAAEEMLHACGYEVENPARNEAEDGEDADWIDYMRLSLVQLSKSDGIAVLSEWEKSKGARIEVELFTSLDLPVMPFDMWIRHKEDYLD